MPKGQRTEIIEEIKRLLLVDDRYVDQAFRFAVYHRGKDGAEKARVLDTVYGGRFDRLANAYVEPQPEDIRIHEVECHEGQIPVLLHDNPAHLRVVAMGSPGAGKTFAAVRRALRSATERPNSIGGLVGPTNDRRLILWRDFLELAESRGYVKKVRKSDKEIVLQNNTVVQVLAAAKPSIGRGNPLQGRSWDWCVVDESQNVENDAHTEIATRGRRAGRDYRIYETCTNASVPEFRVRMARYKEDPQVEIIRFRGQENPWIDPEWWNRLKNDLSERDYRQQILVEDLAPEMLVYNAFDYKESLQQIPHNAVDVTKEITQERYRHAASYVVGQDFGVLVNASIVLKAYRGTDGSIMWFAIDELTTYRQTTDIHAALLRERYPNLEDVLVIGDPHINTKEADKSDYHMFRKAGFNIVSAAPSGQIRVKGRIAMVNALFKDAAGNRRLFIACDANRRPNCQKLTESLLTLEYDHAGRPQPPRKDRKDMTHWPDALGYGVYPWERVRGNAMLQVL